MVHQEVILFVVCLLFCEAELSAFFQIFLEMSHCYRHLFLSASFFTQPPEREERRS